MEIAGVPKIPIATNVTLDKRKSKVVNSKESTGLLAIGALPHLTRNVSETQLLAIKSAGTVNNVTKSQFYTSLEFNSINYLIFQAQRL